jgi:hypothetical protein
MHASLTPAEAAEHVESLRLTDQLRAARQLGTLNEAAAAAGVSLASASRWLARRAAFEAGDPRALLRGKSTGRPAQCAPTAEDLQVLRGIYLKTNRAHLTGSAPLAARMLARTGELSEDVSTAILKPRASKALPKCLRDAMHIAPPLFAHHRNPKDANLDGFFIPGALRMVREEIVSSNRQSTIGHRQSLRRLVGGERQSWDDATVNFGICVPWPWGGDPCSDRYGVKLGRFQLLTCVDDASDFCPGYSYVVRAEQSYRAEDTVAAQFRLCRDQYAPRRFLLEGGAWQSQRARAFYGAAGIGVDDATGRPHCKLIESWFNRLWTVLSVLPGQVGRFRGEMQREGKDYLAARAGRLDPRTCFPSLEQALNDLDAAIAHLNAEQVVSKKYGSWIPQELHAAGLARAPRPRLDANLFYFAAPVVERRQVRRNMVGVTCPSPLGGSFPYHFATDDLWQFEGAYVKIYFDPFDSPLRATIVLDQEHHGVKAGHVISQRALCLEDAPEVMRLLDGMSCEINATGMMQAIAMRQKIHGAIRREYRALGFGGRDVARTSEARDPKGNVARLELHSSATVQPEQAQVAQGLSSLSARLSPDPEADSCACPVGGRFSAAAETRPATLAPRLKIRSRLELANQT